MDTYNGWKALQRRRQEAMDGFDREARELMRRMVEVIPTTIERLSPSFAERFMSAMREVWEEWLVKPPLLQEDLVINVHIDAFEQAAVIRREEQSLKTAWVSYARVDIQPGSRVEITLH